LTVLLDLEDGEKDEELVQEGREPGRVAALMQRCSMVEFETMKEVELEGGDVVEGVRKGIWTVAEVGSAGRRGRSNDEKSKLSSALCLRRIARIRCRALSDYRLERDNCEERRKKEKEEKNRQRTSGLNHGVV
jgi:hypothetical protein